MTAPVFDYIAGKIRAEQLARLNGIEYGYATTATSAATLALTAVSSYLQYFTGSTAGQVVTMPDATTLDPGAAYELVNLASVSVEVQDNAAATLLTLQPSQRVRLKLLDSSAAAGTWDLEDRLGVKAGQVAAATFSGTPLTAAVVFNAPFPANVTYAVIVTGEDGRSWKTSSRAATGFTIDAQANAALTGPVSWIAIVTGETVE